MLLGEEHDVEGSFVGCHWKLMPYQNYEQNYSAQFWKAWRQFWKTKNSEVSFVNLEVFTGACYILCGIIIPESRALLSLTG